jgi:hypothetical protein
MFITSREDTVTDKGKGKVVPGLYTPFIPTELSRLLPLRIIFRN